MSKQTEILNIFLLNKIQEIIIFIVGALVCYILGYVFINALITEPISLFCSSHVSNIMMCIFGNIMLAFLGAGFISLFCFLIYGFYLLIIDNWERAEDEYNRRRR